MKNSKWTTEKFTDEPIYVAFFVSRNKDNKEIPNFKQRKMSFITQKTPAQLYPNFEMFAKEGQKGEMSRFYYSVNARDPKKIYKKLLHYLIDNPDVNLCSLTPKIAGIAAKKECALENKWMFDFDSTSALSLDAFCDDIEKETKDTVSFRRTPHGFSVISEKHFDPRELLSKWGDIVTLKRDDLYCAYWTRQPI